MKQMHLDVCRFLEEIDSDFHETAADTLAARIDISVIKPIDIALRLIKVIELIGQDQVPCLVSVRWDYQISQALNKGGIKIDL